MSEKANCIIEVYMVKELSIEQSPFEIVELKGIGHPDSLADGISETVATFFHTISKPQIPPYIYSVLAKI